ncbi:MAG: hypothetical protein P4L62_02715 [Candidatus Pacebacteria bacterium]|nr:hypothetical protein [Candidatus Paceibacterota bacterium]MDR3583245.1 hypothetical protein [Candidatus Paceibacterota bacterium]
MAAAHKIKRRLIKIILVIFLLGLPGYTHASAFVVYLYFNPTNQTLSFDKQASIPVALDKSISPDYVSFSENNSKGSYILKLYDTNNQEIISTEFSQQNGAFSLQIPYFSLANSIKIFSQSSGKEILSADLSKFNTCNGNGICEFERGENVTTCLGDCGTSHVTYSNQTKQLLSEHDGALKDPDTGQILLQDKAFVKTNNSGQSQNASAITGTQTTPSANQSNNQTSPTASNSNSAVPVIILVIAVILVIVGIILYKKYFKKNNDNEHESK